MTNINNLKKLSKDDLKNFFNIVGIASTYQIITNGISGVYEGTHQFIRDIQVAQLLQEKFPNMPYGSSDGFKTWLEQRMAGSNQSYANALNRLQGDGAGEVDFIRNMQGRLLNLFKKADYAREQGNIASNIPGIDAQEFIRITGEKANEFQIKTLRSPDTIKQTIKSFVENEQYNPDITLVGPKELIEEAKAQGLRNPTKVMGTIQENADSADRLSDKILSNKMETQLTIKSSAKKIAGGAVVGAAVCVGISSITNYIDYKNGKITKEEMFSNIGKDGAKGGITGGALSGLSLFIPGGILGFGVGLVVGTTLRRMLDDAFGDGMFGEILDLTYSVQANIKKLHEGSIYIVDLIEADGNLMKNAISTVDDLKADRFAAINNIQNLEKNYHGGQFITRNNSAGSILDKLDKKKEEMEG
ncbi:MAG: hypothetical protein ACOCRK_11750 [bacterium]